MSKMSKATRSTHVNQVLSSAVLGLALTGMLLVGTANAASAAEQPKSDRVPVTTKPAKAPDAPKSDAPKATSSEVRTPSILTLGCAQTDGTPKVVKCTWAPIAGADTSGIASFMLLRSDGGPRGRAFGPYPVSVSVGIDIQPVAGATYSYLVVALSSAGKTLGHSDPFPQTIS